MPNRSIVEGCRDTPRLRPAPSWGGQATSVATSCRSAVGGWGRRGFGVTTSEMGRDYRLGYSLTLLQRGYELRVRPRCPAPQEPPGPGKSGPQPNGPSHRDLVGADSSGRVPGRAGGLSGVVLAAMNIPHAIGMRGPVPWDTGPIRSCGRTSLGSCVASALRPGPPRRWQPSRYRCPAPRCNPSPRSVGRPSTHLAAPSEARSGRARPDAAVGVRVFGGRVPTGRRHGDADEAVPIASGCVPRPHGHENIHARSASGGRSDPGASATPWPLSKAGDGLPGPRVHRSLPPGSCGPCSLPGQRAPQFFTEQNGGRPMTRAMEQGMDAPARVLRLPRVQARTGLARSTIYVRVADGSFPQPIRLGARAVGWIESEVDAWIREQIAASRSSAE